MDDFLKRQNVVVALAHKECGNEEYDFAVHNCIETVKEIPTANVVEIPRSGIGDLSDGYHTFNGLYYQRMVLFAALVKVFKHKAWKSLRHEDGELCFGGGWFIVGIDTPTGSYTYHYENKYFNLFECEELPEAKHWDGHTEEDVKRLLSLAKPEAHSKWINKDVFSAKGNVDMLQSAQCKMCGKYHTTPYSYDFTHYDFCPNCGAKMIAT